LLETIRDQAIAGDFEEVGTVQSVEAHSTYSSENNQEGGFVSRGSIGLPLVVALAALALLAIGGVIFFWCRKKKRNALVIAKDPESKQKNEATDDSSNEGELKPTTSWLKKLTTKEDPSLVDQTTEAMNTCLPNCCYWREVPNTK